MYVCMYVCMYVYVYVYVCTYTYMHIHIGAHAVPKADGCKPWAAPLAVAASIPRLRPQKMRYELCPFFCFTCLVPTGAPCVWGLGYRVSGLGSGLGCVFYMSVKTEAPCVFSCVLSLVVSEHSPQQGVPPVPVWLLSTDMKQASPI